MSEILDEAVSPVISRAKQLLSQFDSADILQIAVAFNTENVAGWELSNRDIPRAIIFNNQGIRQACISLLDILKTPTGATPSNNPQYRPILDELSESTLTAIKAHPMDMLPIYIRNIVSERLVNLASPELGSEYQFYGDHGRYMIDSVSMSNHWIGSLRHQFGEEAVREAILTHSELFNLVGRHSLLEYLATYVCPVSDETMHWFRESAHHLRGIPFSAELASLSYDR